MFNQFVKCSFESLFQVILPVKVVKQSKNQNNISFVHLYCDKSKLFMF